MPTVLPFRPVVLAVLAVALVACGSSGGPSTRAAGLSPLDTLPTGEPLPAASLASLDGDDALDTGSLQGPAVINFWATWCAFCVDEMPDLEAVHRRLDGRVRFIGVDVEDQHDRARTLARETGVTYELVTDPDRSFFRSVQGRGMPTTLLVDARGRIAYRHTGPLTAEQLLALVDEHLDVAIPG